MITMSESNPVDEILEIGTPENVVFGYEVAGLGSRFLAALLDWILLIFLEMVVFGTLLFLLSLLGGLDRLAGGLSDTAVGLALALLTLIGFIFYWGYFVFFELLWNGQSPGKRWYGLRVLRTDGQPIGIVESVIRNLVRFIDFLPGMYGIGVLSMFISEQARRLGDFAAGTLVVYDRGPVTLESLGKPGRLPTPLIYADRAAGLLEDLPVERLTDADYELAESFLRRQHSLANRDRLARDLAASLYRRMGAEPPPRTSPAEAIAFLHAVLAARQQ